MHRTPLGESQLAITIRPLQVAHFLPNGDETALARAIAMATGRWGGLFHQLIPVDPGGTIDPFARRCLRAAPPDLAVAPWLPGTAEHESVRRILADLFPGRVIDLHGADTNPAILLRPLDLLTRGVLRQHWPPEPALLWSGSTAEFSFSRGTIADPGAPAWLPSLRDGALRDDDHAEYAAIFRFSGGGATMADEYYWSWQGSNNFNSSLLNLTTFGLVERAGVASAPVPWLEVVVVGDVRSACLFWNLRASRAAGLLGRPGATVPLAVSPAALGRPAIVDALAAVVAARDGGGLGAPFDLAVIVADGDAATVAGAELAGRANFVPVPGEIVAAWSSGGPSPAAQRDVRARWSLFALTQDESPLLATVPRSVEVVAEESYPARVSLRAGANAVPYSPPPHFRNARAALVSRDLESATWGRYPSDAAVAALIAPGAAFRGAALAARVAQPDRPGEVTFDLPEEWAALAAYFGARGYRPDPSAAGTAGAAVLDLLGGVTGLDLLASPLAYRLLQAIAPQNTKKVAQRVGRQVEALAGREEDLARALADRIGPDALLGVPMTFAELKGRLVIGGKDGPALLETLADLNAAGALLRGYYLPCPRCNTREWYPLAEVRERLVCPGCGTPFPLPVAGGPGVELAWHHRPNGLIGRAVDLDVLPHLLTLRCWASRDVDPACIVTGLELREGTGRDAIVEFDLIFVSGGALHAAECKAGASLTEKDFASARRAAALGIVKFAFATTAESWDAGSAAGIAALEAELAGQMKISAWAAPELFLAREPGATATARAR